MDQASLSVEHPAAIRPPLMSGWSNEDFELLLKMYSDKVPLVSLAAHFKKTRGQISGVIFRARERGLVGAVRVNVVKPPPPPKAPKATVNFSTVRLAAKLAVPVPKKPRVRLRLIENSTVVTFAELEPHHCRWPIGDPRLSDFRFCGCTRVLGKPYCVEHVTMAGRMYDKDPVRRMVIRPSYRR